MRRRIHLTVNTKLLEKGLWLVLLVVIIILIWYNQFALVIPNHQYLLQQPQQPKKSNIVSSIETSTGSTSNATNSKTKDLSRPSYYVVFSTSCSLQQDWESYVFFYHCLRVKQPGKVVRIVSGCTDVQEQKLNEFHNAYIATIADLSIQSFHVHFTPNYSTLYRSEGKYPYKYMNKPYGLRHWMEHSLQLNWTTTSSDKTITSPHSIAEELQRHEKLLDGVVILMDPDMILLRPITHDFTTSKNVQWVQPPPNRSMMMVRHGNPISQQDGYLSNEWMYFNFSFITGDSTIQAPRKSSDGPIYWNTGPPYLATVYDMYRIVSLWTETAPRVLHVYPQLFAEMYGFVIATVMLQLPFRMIKSIVVSTTSASDREGWSYVDTIPDQDICQTPTRATSVNSTMIRDLPLLPFGLHYCGIYLLKKSMFSKYRVKKNILNCDKGLMKPPTTNDWYPHHNYKIYPRRADLSDTNTYKEVKVTIPQKQAKREAFMICGMISALNEALRFYKRQACGNNDLPVANMNETYTIHDDPTDY